MRRATITILLFISGFFLRFTDAYGQTYSCSELAEYVTSNYDSRDLVTCFNSSMLIKAEYFRLDDHGFVIAYIKNGDYDFYGNPYIFCGISSFTWSNFRSAGQLGSWGKSFHQYIMDNKCNCR